MRMLKTTWIRVIASLFAGGIVAELITLSTTDYTSPQFSNIGLHLLFAILIYFVLTWYVNKFVKNAPPPL
nr:putative membrane protein [Mucilaginibacter sp. X5P1]